MSSATKNMKLKMKAEPQSPPPETQVEDQPLIGVLANIPLQWNSNTGCFVGPSGFVLKQQLSKRGFRPLKVEVLCCGQRGHSGFALVYFDLLEQATMFGKSFQKGGCGKWEWNNALVSPSNKFLYGWIATNDDYRFEGIVGQHLRKTRGLNLKGVFDDMKEEQQDQKTVLHHNTELHSSKGGRFSSFLIDDLLKQKDEVVQRYHQDMGKAHQSAQKYLENIISQREDVRVLLKQEIEMRSTALVVGQVLNNETGLRKIHKEKLMIENASLEQRKADHNLVLLLEKHKKQKEELHRGIIDFEKGVEEKHMLELEMEQMKGALKVMRHMGDAGDEEMLAKIDTIQERLKEKEQYKCNRLEAMNQTLGVHEDLQRFLKEGSKGISTCIKSDADLDYKPFVHVAKRICFDDKEVGLSSEWNYYLEDPSWNPFSNIEGIIKEEMDINDQRFKCFRKEDVDDEAYNVGGKNVTFK